MAYELPAVAAAPTNININSPGASIDGVTLTAGQRVLLTQQGSQNGVWIWNGSAVAMTRPTGTDQFKTRNVLDNATLVPVTGGNTYGGTVWGVDPAAIITVDTTSFTLTRPALGLIQTRLATTANITLSSPGAVIDGNTVTDGSMTTGGSSTTLTCSTSQPFTSADVGKTIVVTGAGAAGANLVTTIVAYTSSSVVTLATGCSTSVTGATVQYGVTLNVGDLVLVRAQSTASDNGVYAWNGATSAMTRTSEPLTPERHVVVSEGTVNAHTRWVLTTQAPLKLGTTALTFSPKQFNLGVYPATTVANLQALPGPFNPGDAVLLEGYYATDDGGGGTLTFDGTTISSTALQSSAISGGASNTTPVTITAAGHPFVTGQAVLISGNSNAAVNGPWLIANVTSSTFDLVGSVASGGGTGGTANSVKITASAPHGFQSGQRVFITRNSVSAINATWLNVGVLSPTVFSIATSTTPGSGGTFGDKGMTFPSTAVDGRWLRTDPSLWNPKMFGAVVDNVHDDLPAYQAMFVAIPKDVAVMIVSPPGVSYISDDLEVARHVHWIGKGGSNSDSLSSGLRFPPLKGIKIRNVQLSSDGGTATYTMIDHLYVTQKIAIVMDPTGASDYGGLASSGGGETIRLAGQFIEKGNWVIYSGATVGAAGTQCQAGSGTHNDVAFRALSGFTPSGSEPAAFSTAGVAQIGTTITDGSGSWFVESVPKDWRALQPYVVGQRAIVPGDNRFVYECTVAGTSGASMPVAFAQDGTPGTGLLDRISDSSVTWKIICPAVVLSIAEAVKLQHIQIFGGMGFGIHLHSGPVQTSPLIYVGGDFCDVLDVQAFYCGGGVHLHGRDTNGCTTQNVRYYGQSLQQRTTATTGGGRMGTGEIGIWDRSLSGGVHIGGYMQTAFAPGYASDSYSGATPGAFNPTIGNGTKWYPAGDESQAAYLGPGAVQIGSTNSGFGTDGGPTTFDQTGCVGVLHRTRTGLTGFPNNQTWATPLIDQAINFHGVYGVRVDPYIQNTAWWQDQINGISIGTGCFALTLGPYGGISRSPNMGGFKPIIGFTYQNAKNVSSGPGPGDSWLRIYNGWLNGEGNPGTSALFHGTDANTLTDFTLRYGKRLVGDTFPDPNATHASGTFRRVIVTTAGYRAPKWTGSIQYSLEQDNVTFTAEATTVEPSSQPSVYSDGTGFVWRIINGTLSNPGAGHEPTWPSNPTPDPINGTTFTDSNLTTWRCIGATCVVQVYEPVSDRLQVFTQDMSTADHTIATTRSVVQTTGNLTVNRTLTWNGASAGDRRVLDNQCTGAFAVKVSPATGDLSTNGVANGKCASIYFDGTNWRRASADATP